MRSSLSLAFCLLLAGAAEAQDLNVITGVEVRAEGTSVVVTVKGSKPPNFTTFSMADPARFVIDLSEARFQGVPEDLRVDDGVIRVIKNLAYGSGASAIARVMLAFSQEVEPPDVQTDGTSLVVKVLRPGAPAVAAGAAPPAAAPAAGAIPDPAVAAAATAKAEADEAARQEALARDRRETEAREQARLAAESSAKERETQARLETEARAREAEKAAAEQAAAEQAANAAAEARRAEIKAKIAAEEGQAQKLTEPAPAVAPSAGSEAEAQARAEERARREVDEALAAQQASEARAPPPTAPSPAPPAAPPTVPVATAPPVAAPVAPPAAEPVAPPLAARVAEPVAARPESPVATPSRPAKLQAVGFSQLPTVSRVFVKTSATPRFTITDVGDDVVRLEVENTWASRRNDVRPLDTSFFPSAVAMITPSRQGTSYVVDIRLKKRVPYQQKVEGSVLAIDFERPPRAATPGGAATEATQENQQGLLVSPEDRADGAEPGEPEPATEPAPKQ